MKEDWSYKHLFNIPIKKYSRIKRWKITEVSNFKDLIIHYRDAIVHNSFKEI
jgi:hypothetical protein